MSGDDRNWFLINASPDLAKQIESAPALQPCEKTSRNSPIAGVLLTNADIDHALGLILLRQRETPLVVYANDETRATLNWIDKILDRFCGIEWRITSTDIHPLGSGINFRAIELRKSVAFQLGDESSKAVALVAPAVGELTDQLGEAVNTSDLVLFDGTFWDENELRAFRPGARTAREMNHLPIKHGSLEFLRDLPARRKIYTHINNTNPILMPGSSERTEVERAGIEIAYDGMEIVL